MPPWGVNRAAAPLRRTPVEMLPVLTAVGSSQQPRAGQGRGNENGTEPEIPLWVRLVEATPLESRSQAGGQAAPAGLGPDASEAGLGSILWPSRFLGAATSAFCLLLHAAGTRSRAAFYSPARSQRTPHCSGTELALEGRRTGETRRKIGWRSLAGWIAPAASSASPDRGCPGPTGAPQQGCLSPRVQPKELACLAAPNAGFGEVSEPENGRGCQELGGRKSLQPATTTSCSPKPSPGL